MSTPNIRPIQAANQRRSQRILLSVPLRVSGKRTDGTPFVEHTTTQIVNAHGALVELGISLDQGQVVTLLNVRTADKTECAVKLVTQVEGKKFNTALEFTKPNPGFWRISFPPDDWTSKSPDAKKYG